MKIAKYIFLLAIVSSCVPQRRLQYLQTDSQSPDKYDLEIPVENKIAPGNYLTVNVNSPDERNFFGGETEMMTAGDELTLTRSAYLVDSLGEVNLPVIGKVKVGGLTLSECSDKLQHIVKSYMGDPIVDVRFAYKTFTMLGEVNAPGRYYFASKDLNMFEAIGMAGDLTFYGKRKKVYIIRETNNQTKKIEVDLTDDEIMLSKNYFIHDNDIILVKSRNYIRWEEISTPLGVIMSSISLLILVSEY